MLFFLSTVVVFHVRLFHVNCEPLTVAGTMLRKLVLNYSAQEYTNDYRVSISITITK